MLVSFNPFWATTDWRAVCGRTACTVLREGRRNSMRFPYPYPEDLAPRETRSGSAAVLLVSILSMSRIEPIVRIATTTPSLPFCVSKTQHDGAEHSNVSFRTHSFSQTVRAVTGCYLGFRETCGFVVH
jgi:hypothetical protein